MEKPPLRPAEDVRAEVQALWSAVFGEPPVVQADASTLLEHLVTSLPVPEYTTLRRYGVIEPK